jgi:hypothetical protein
VFSQPMYFPYFLLFSGKGESDTLLTPHKLSHLEHCPDTHILSFLLSTSFLVPKSRYSPKEFIINLMDGSHIHQALLDQARDICLPSSLAPGPWRYCPGTPSCHHCHHQSGLPEAPNPSSSAPNSKSRMLD